MKGEEEHESLKEPLGAGMAGLPQRSSRPHSGLYKVYQGPRDLRTEEEGAGARELGGRPLIGNFELDSDVAPTPGGRLRELVSQEAR